MQTNRTAGRLASFTISLVDDAGDKVEASAVAWQLFDERGGTIAEGDAVDFNASDDVASFEIGADDMQLPDAVPSQGRELVLLLTTDAGEIELRDYFLLVANQPLALMVNSFVSYPEALSIRAGFGPTMDGWDAMTDRDSRASALADAFERLLRMSYKVPFMDASKHASSYAAYGTGEDVAFDATRRLRLRGMTVAELDALPDSFVKAIKRAQLIEANIILGGDVVGKKRQDGIISETIGESSAFFNSKPYLNLPISRQAYEELRRFIIFKVGVARG